MKVTVVLVELRFNQIPSQKSRKLYFRISERKFLDILAKER